MYAIVYPDPGSGWGGRSMLVDDLQGVLQALGVMVQRLDDVVVGLLPRMALGHEAVLDCRHLLEDKGLEFVITLLPHPLDLLELATHLLILLLAGTSLFFHSRLRSGLMVPKLLGYRDLALSPVDLFVLERVLHSVGVLRHDGVLVFYVLNVLLAGEFKVVLHGAH